MTPRTSTISSSQEVAVGTHFHMQHGTKTTLLFLPADGEASLFLLLGLVSLLSGSTLQLENTYSCILKMTSQVRENQQNTTITFSYWYHQQSSPYISFIWSNDSGSVFTNPLGKDGVKDWSM